MNRNAFFAAATLFPAPAPALLMSLVLIAGCRKAPHDQTTALPEPPVVPVRTTTVETKSMPSFEEVAGTVRAKLRSTIEAKASGRIVEFPVLLGQRIKCGDLLARLDAPETKARLDQAETTLRQAQRDWNRVSTLFSQQSATRADYETAESRLQGAKAAVTEARAMLDYAEVKAPFDAVVTRKVADVGDLAAPGKPLLELEDPSRLQLEADVPEALAGNIQPDARLVVRTGVAGGERIATVAEIAPNADAHSRTFRVKLDLPDGQGLMSGQFSRLAVPIGEIRSMRVPSAAVVQRGQMEIAFTVENAHARLHLVKTGRQFKGETEILSGLDPGDAVVIENVPQLLDGQPVKTQ